MTRERLPNRRASISFELEVAGLRYTATVSRFADGRIGELFLSNHKSNSTADTNARDAAACRRCITTALVKIHARATH